MSHAAFHSFLSHTHTVVTHPSRQWISHRGSFAWGVGTMDGTGVTSCPAWWVVSVYLCVRVCVSVGGVSIPRLRVKRLLPLSTPASWVSLRSILPCIPVLLYLSLPSAFPSRRVEAIVGLSGVGFCSPAAASSPHGPCKTRLLLPQGPQASAALPPNKFAVTLSAIGPWIGSK